MQLTDLINCDFIIRVSAAVAFGFCIGLERELTNKYAGLRTHIMVALGACIFTLISIYGFPTFASGDNVIVTQATGVRDTARVAAQVVTGIGFIGAGTVLRNGPIVLGLTTASTLWIAASIGMACGAGMYEIAFAGTTLAILTLVIIRFFERNILPSSTKKTTIVKINVVCPQEQSETIQDYIIDRYPEISEIKKRQLSAEDNNVKISCVVTVNEKKSIKDLYKSLQHFEKIESVSIQEYNE